MRRGQQLRFAQPRLGARAYLAAPGGFSASAVLGSCSSMAREQLGGLHGDGKPLAMGDHLQWMQSVAAPRPMDARLIPQFTPAPRLELVMGAQIGDFSGRSLFDVFNSAWKIDTRTDRMGMRLLGPRLQAQRSTTISEGIPLGAVQVPPDGQPIILLNERQTIGGYPRLGALTPQAVARLAQCLPGEQLQLAPVLQETAQESHLRLLEQWQHD
ncbi:KipI antagonist [compost metagenome]